MSVILCPHCGTSNRVGSNFCNACGTDLRPGDEPSPPAEPVNPRPTTPDTDAIGPRHDPDGQRQTRRRTFPEEPPAGQVPDSTTEHTDADAGRDDPHGSKLSGQPWLDAEFDAEFDDESAWDADTNVDPDSDPSAPGSQAHDRGDEPDTWARDDSRDDSRDDFGDGFDDEVGDEIGHDEPDSSQGPRLITGVQGLLDPIRISAKLEETRLPGLGPEPSPLGVAPEQATWPSMLGDGPAQESLRRFRNLLAEEPRPAGVRDRPPPIATAPTLHIPWLFLLLAVVLGLSIPVGLGGGDNLPPEWPGVADAHSVINSLPSDATVLVYWAYDPATAGELDLAARPVMRHLLERRARVVGVSSLPAGPATARRLMEDIRQTRVAGDAFSAASRNPWPVVIEYLPGGAGALPLIATGSGLIARWSPDASGQPTPGAQWPALAVVFGAQAEDVQAWLEQVQPRNGAPVVAVVSAAADPMLRPYLDSGQLRGLVSGFDGAYHYQTRLDPQESRSDGVAIRRHADAQNWAHLVILATLALGNMAVIIGRTGRA